MTKHTESDTAGETGRRFKVTQDMIETGVAYVRAEWDFSEQLLRELSECDLAEILRALGFDVAGEGEEVGS